jgi:hypothetical protein
VPSGKNSVALLKYNIPPFGAPQIRAVKKEMKAYMWDWSVIADEGHRMELRYIRDTDKREVDFVVIKDGKPLYAV